MTEDSSYDLFEELLYRKSINRDLRKTNKYYFYKKKYNLSIDEFLKLIPTHCPICGILFSHHTSEDRKTQPVVDHDHTTGKVRGILCNRCNSGLGLFKDNKTSLENAITYLNNCEVK